MSSDLNKLIDDARDHVMTDEEREAQRRSFAYGNVHLHNPLVTRQMIDEVAAEYKPSASDDANRQSCGGGR